MAEIKNQRIQRTIAIFIAACFLFLVQSAFAGTIVGWGGMVTDSSQFDANDFIAISASIHSLALKSDGSIIGWGGGGVTPPDGNDYVAIAAGLYYSLALKSDGSIVGWGSGAGATPPEGNDFVAIVSSTSTSFSYSGYSLALKSDGSIVGWGENSHGQATPPDGNDFVALAAGERHSLALRADGSIVGWGENSHGKATPPEGNDFVAIAAGGSHSLALKSDGSIIAWGAGGPGQSGWPNYGQATPPEGNNFVAIAASEDHSLALKSDGSIVGWGSNVDANYKYIGQATPPKGNDFVAIATGHGHSLALKSDGSIIGWGSNVRGQAVPPTGNDFVEIAAGGTHSLALKFDGSIVGWGSNFAQSATRTWDGQATPPVGNDFVAIAAGECHSLALKSNGSIVGWGSNSGDWTGAWYGQATPPDGNDFVAIAAGGYHSLALKSNGFIVGWGSNNWGYDEYGQATPPDGNDFVAIAAGGYHSLALKSDGSIIGWGYNKYGQATPPNDNNFVAIAAGHYHSLALRFDGSIVAWGSNLDWNDQYLGQATPPEGNDFVAITAGSYHSVALKSDGSIVDWGGWRNTWIGQATPPDGNDFVTIAAGMEYSLAIRDASAKYGGGAGEPNDPYLIYTAYHLNSIATEPNDWNKHFKLMADIDLTGYSYDKALIAPDIDTDEYYFQGIPYVGVFDGNGHTISHLTITGVSYLGLFGELAFGAEVKDLGVVDVNISGSGDSVGGLLGHNQRGAVMIRCYSTGTVNGDDNIGGLVGSNGGHMTQCYSRSTVSGNYIAGGLLGANEGQAAVTDCYSTGAVNGDDVVAGLVGFNLGEVTHCYSAGAVTGDQRLGGLVGWIYGSIVSSFWDIQTSGQINMCGSQEEDASGCDDSFGLTTDEMQTVDTFLEAGWDFVDETENGTEDIWRILEGQDYPRLWWELIPEVVGRTIYVDDDANGANDGSSWADAFCSLQDALAAAQGGNEIRVAQGTYKPDQTAMIMAQGGFQVISSGDRTETFRLINGVSLKGGYAGFGEVNPDERDIERYKSILSGDLNGDDGPYFTNNTENSYHVVRGDGTDSTAVLDGFTITAGNADGIRQPEKGSGGGMYNVSGSPTITYCTFRGNFADWGGAINNKEGCDAKITNCTFIGNSANFGGAINNNERSNPQITNCIFIENTAEEGGAMMNITESNVIITNCTFTGNRASNNGGGISCADTSSTAINTILWGNSPNEIRIWNSSIAVIYCNVQGGWPGLGNINTDPLFADAVNGDCHLKSQAGRWDPVGQNWIIDDVTSPCIDAGDPTSLIGLELAPNGSRINMGAYGGTAEASLSLPDMTDIEGLAMRANYYIEDKNP